MYTNSHHQAAQRPPSDKNFSIIKIIKKKFIFSFRFSLFSRFPFTKEIKKKKNVNIFLFHAVPIFLLVLLLLFSFFFFLFLWYRKTRKLPFTGFPPPPPNNSNTYIVVVPERGNFHPWKCPGGALRCQAVCQRQSIRFFSSCVGIFLSFPYCVDSFRVFSLSFPVSHPQRRQSPNSLL